MSKRTALLALASAVLLAIALAWLLVDDSAQPGGVHADTQPPTPGTAPTPAQPDHPQPASSASGPSQRTEFESARSTPTAEYALHVPDYGPALQRPFARAEFELRDARGEPLEGAVLVGAELWRKVGDEWVRHEAELDRALSRIECKGAGDGGLPPGEYELEVRAGPYGALREPFTLARGDALWRTLELPNRRRIVRVRFEDSRGQPLKRITQAPQYVYEPVELVDVPRSRVGAPPPPEIGLLQFIAPNAEAAAEEANSLPPMSRAGWEAYYETDRGMLCVRVFAGLQSKLTIDLESWRWGRGRVVLESDFFGEEWEGYPVALDPIPGLDEQMATWVQVNQGDPGLNSLLGAPINPVAGGSDPDDLSDLLPGYVRVVVKLSSPAPVRMLSEAGTPRRASSEFTARAPWAADDVWFMDVMRDPEIETLSARFSITDERLLFVEAPPIELPRASDQRRIETSFRVDAIPVSLELVPPGATLAAYAQSVDVSVVAGGAGAERSLSIARDRGGSLRVVTGVTEEFARALLAQTALTLRYRSGDGPTFEARHELTNVEREALISNGLRLEALGDGLVGRVVDGALEGLAGVWCVVVGEDQLATAEQMRRSSIANAEAGPTAAAQAARQIAGLTGWLDGENVVQSDRDGYLLDDRLRLTRNRRHGLFFFWRQDSGLRGHRIDFVATDGVTDLGAVRLP